MAVCALHTACEVAHARRAHGSVIAVIRHRPPRASASGGRQARLPELLRFAAWIRPRVRSSTNHRTSIAGDAFLERALDAAIAVADTDIRGS
jgi:hypothetical protein